MNVSETSLAGAFTLNMDRRRDNRGYFARMFCAETFINHGLNPAVAQGSISYNAKRGTLRGLHFQYPPAAETKVLQCIKGAVADVIVDLRPESPTYLRHVCTVLSEDNGRGLYVPERFAHGYITLTDNTELVYLISGNHNPSAEGGLPHDDPALDIAWPVDVSVISERDRKWKPYSWFGAELQERMALLAPESQI